MNAFAHTTQINVTAEILILMQIRLDDVNREQGFDASSRSRLMSKDSGFYLTFGREGRRIDIDYAGGEFLISAEFDMPAALQTAVKGSLEVLAQDVVVKTGDLDRLILALPHVWALLPKVESSPDWVGDTGYITGAKDAEGLPMIWASEDEQGRMILGVRLEDGTNTVLFQRYANREDVWIAHAPMCQMLVGSVGTTFHTAEVRELPRYLASVMTLLTVTMASTYADDSMYAKIMTRA